MFQLQRTWTAMELLPLVCFCLLICSGTTFGDEGSSITPIRVKEGEDVILPCSLGETLRTTGVFVWKKNNLTKVLEYNAKKYYEDPQFKGRVFHSEIQLQSGNASIVIRKTKKTDTGNYSCIFPHHQPKIRSIIELLVDCILKDRTEEKIAGSCPKPSVTIVALTKDWALLQCEIQIQDGFPDPKVEWLDSDNNSVPVTNTTEGKYIILKATVTKSDFYRCVSTQEEICHQIDRKINITFPGSSTGLIVGVIVLSIVLVIVLAVGAVLYFKRKYRDNPAEAARFVEPKEDNPNDGQQNGAQQPMIPTTDDKDPGKREENHYENDSLTHSKTSDQQNDKDPAKHEGDTTDKNKSANHEEMELMSSSDGTIS